MRFYEVHEGQILIDDVNVKEISKKNLRSMLSMVLLGTLLFIVSIMDNIKYDNIQASIEEVINAAEAAHIHHFIKTQPSCYDMTIYEDANNISQGQKQLLTIAHRLSSIRDTDTILVMKDGNIIEQGNHLELMSQNGFYTELYNSQY